MTRACLKLVPKQPPATGYAPGRADRPHPLLDACVCHVPGLTCMVCPRGALHYDTVTARRRAWGVQP